MTYARKNSYFCFVFNFLTNGICERNMFYLAMEVSILLEYIVYDYYHIDIISKLNSIKNFFYEPKAVFSYFWKRHCIVWRIIDWTFVACSACTCNVFLTTNFRNNVFLWVCLVDWFYSLIILLFFHFALRGKNHSFIICVSEIIRLFYLQTYHRGNRNIKIHRMRYFAVEHANILTYLANFSLNTFLLSYFQARSLL